MNRRWIIRGLALALLTICVVAWVGSYWHDSRLRYVHGVKTYSLGLTCGLIYFHNVNGPSVGVDVLDAEHRLVADSPWSAEELYVGRKFRLLGFSYGDLWFNRLDLKGTFVLIPLWFPSLLSALLFWFVLRKTKSKLIGGSFPIESTAKPGDPKP